MQVRALWWKLVILAGVTVLLSIVLMRIGWVVDERQGRQREAQQSVAEAQAGEQVLLGPLLQRSCTEEWESVSGSGAERRVNHERRDFTLSALPTQLGVDGEFKQEPRYRGLFKINGYQGRLQLDARWNSLEALQPRSEQPNGRLSCETPRVMLALSDARGLRSVAVQHEGQALALRPGTRSDAYPRGLHAMLPEQAPTQPLQLRATVQLVGMSEFALVPAASATEVKLRSDWPHPSFGGRFLPSARQVGPQGFQAQWQVSELASNAVAGVRGGQVVPGLGGEGKQFVDTLNFAMLDPVNPYVMSDRAIKYGLLFIVLTFVGVGLLELMAQRRVHPVQYLLVGLAVSLFFLLLLSLSEHLRFGLSYLLATAAVVGLLGFYGSAMLGRLRSGLVFAALMALLYGALYVLLNLEQAALVIGTLLLFATLAAVMAATRRFDWYALGSRISS